MTPMEVIQLDAARIEVIGCGSRDEAVVVLARWNEVNMDDGVDAWLLFSDRQKTAMLM